MTQNSKKTKAQLIEELTALGVNASMNLKKGELVALLDAQSDDGSNAGSGIKPSAPLAGQADLANRTLDWKYVAPAEDSSDTAPTPAPEFVATADPEPAADPEPEPTPVQSTSTAPAPQNADGMSGTTKLLIAIAALVILYWVLF